MFTYDMLNYPYASRRTVHAARNGMVCTSVPSAAQAGLAVLQRGGNAVDAAVAAAAALTVTEPTSNGIGSDAFALVWHKDRLYGLNASGPAPKRISLEAVKELGYEAMPTHGVVPVTVPGAPAAWSALVRRFGRLSLGEVLAPAVSYARDGFPVSPMVAHYWKRAYDSYASALKGDEYKPWFAAFSTPRGTPRAGELWTSPDHAAALKLIGATDGEAFYRGELAERIDQFMRQHGGFLSYDDLAAFAPLWVDPISCSYRGYDVWEIPPNGQGLTALEALRIAEGFSFTDREDERTWHLQIEAMKLAFSDCMASITDPRHMRVDPADLLSDAWIERRRQLIGDAALEPADAELPKSGTVYLAAADRDGTMVSYIQSNYMGFGSGLVVPSTGIALQNRGHTFSLDPSHINCLEGGKRTYHTIIPGFLTRDGVPLGPFGVMGGFMQPQGHMQVIMNTLDFSLNPQAALDAPRWQWIKGRQVLLEQTVPPAIAEALARRGHVVSRADDGGPFGRGQIIWRDPSSGVLIGGTEPRCDGTVAAW